MIQKLRLMKGMQAKELAAKCGIQPVKLSKLESGKYTCQINEIVALANALDVPTDLFFARAGLKVANSTAIEACYILDEIERLDGELKRLLWP